MPNTSPPTAGNGTTSAKDTKSSTGDNNSASDSARRSDATTSPRNQIDQSNSKKTGSSGNRRSSVNLENNTQELTSSAAADDQDTFLNTGQIKAENPDEETGKHPIEKFAHEQAVEAGNKDVTANGKGNRKGPSEGFLGKIKHKLHLSGKDDPESDHAKEAHEASSSHSETTSITDDSKSSVK